jgi:formylglycine-generating enzyme required for sulfatase activity
MSGNLWEWCEDAYTRNYPGSEEATTRRMRFKNNDRILRGGSWNVNPEFSRSANRSRNVPETQMDYDGFRVVMEAK